MTKHMHPKQVTHLRNERWESRSAPSLGLAAFAVAICCVEHLLQPFWRLPVRQTSCMTLQSYTWHATHGRDEDWACLSTALWKLYLANNVSVKPIYNLLRCQVHVNFIFLHAMAAFALWLKQHHEKKGM